MSHCKKSSIANFHLDSSALEKIALGMDALTFKNTIIFLCEGLHGQCNSTGSFLGFSKRSDDPRRMYFDLRSIAVVLYNLQHFILIEEKLLGVDEKMARKICKALESFLNWQIHFRKGRRYSLPFYFKDWIELNQKFLDLFKQKNKEGVSHE